jgi:sugar-specific transcriptional regulator TrmB
LDGQLTNLDDQYFFDYLFSFLNQKERANILSLKKIIKALVKFGFSENDARVYVYVAINGPTIANRIIADLELNENCVYSALTFLQEKGYVVAGYVQPTEFFSIPFEKLLDSLIEAKEKQAKKLRNKRKLLS